MDPQTLPESERALYHAIKARYSVAFEPLRIREHQLQLLKLTDLEQILDGKDPLKDVSAFPFWIKLWEAAIVLSEFIAGMPCEQETSVLELGAGLGAPGLAAAAAGYTVTLSDYEKMILDFERINAAASNLTNVRFSMLDWLNPPEMERYDIILGAEILFREEFFEPLLGILRKALKPEGVVYLAHDIKRRSLEPFLKMAEREYRIAASQRKLKSLEQDKIILLTRLQPRH
ncbi:MAG: methyltransferase domain-containing protein [Desulfobulbus sp.]|jgi:predicted nicotinamide N-methyase|uniref:class I SAM-dependent methyltransferase n=1 Tax=Desulfobulbus sp. TaxID=895 RepID=UPI002843D225|nr:methyltransferase domain-containing protein [Desulfobulbus sp.]MDR2550591.1 methyltransferase domain-containing protein [Desulfobulbus sp.]